MTMAKDGSEVPLVPPRRADDLVGRIEAVTAYAYAGGYGTVAYFLEMALTEARIQLRREEEMHSPAHRISRPIDDSE